MNALLESTLLDDTIFKCISKHGNSVYVLSLSAERPIPSPLPIIHYVRDTRFRTHPGPSSPPPPHPPDLTVYLPHIVPRGYKS